MRRLSSRPSCGELHAVVRAFHLPHVVGRERCDAGASAARDADDVGEVLLPLGVVRVDAGERVAQHGCLERVDPGVDLADRADCVIRVLLLDDPFQIAGRVAHDAAVARGVRDVGGQDRHRVGLRFVVLDESEEGGGGEQRDIAVRDDDRAVHVLGELGERTFRGAARAGDIVLVGHEHGAVEDYRRWIRRARPPARARGAARRRGVRDRCRPLR